MARSCLPKRSGPEEVISLCKREPRGSAWESAQVTAALPADTLLLCVFCPPCAASMQPRCAFFLSFRHVAKQGWCDGHNASCSGPGGPAELSAKVLRRRRSLFHHTWWKTRWLVDIVEHMRVPGFRVLMPTSEPDAGRCRLETSMDS